MKIFSRLFKPQEASTIGEDKTLPKSPSKTCSNCQLSLALTAFNRHSKSRDGYQFWCRKCANSWRPAKPLKTKQGKGKKILSRIRKNNFEKKELHLTVPNVSQDQYRKLVELAKVRKWTMTRLYSQMVHDFLTLHCK